MIGFLDVEAKSAHVSLLSSHFLQEFVELSENSPPAKLRPDINALNPPEQVAAPVAPLVCHHAAAHNFIGYFGDNIKAMLRIFKKHLYALSDYERRELFLLALPGQCGVEFHKRIYIFFLSGSYRYSIRHRFHLISLRALKRRRSFQRNHYNRRRKIIQQRINFPFRHVLPLICAGFTGIS